MPGMTKQGSTILTAAALSISLSITWSILKRQCPTKYAGKTVYDAVAFIGAIKDTEVYAEEAGMLTIRTPGGESGICVITNSEGFAPKPIV